MRIVKVYADKTKAEQHLKKIKVLVLPLQISRRDEGYCDQDQKAKDMEKQFEELDIKSRHWDYIFDVEEFEVA